MVEGQGGDSEEKVMLHRIGTRSQDELWINNAQRAAGGRLRPPIHGRVCAHHLSEGMVSQ